LGFSGVFRSFNRITSRVKLTSLSANVWNIHRTVATIAGSLAGTKIDRQSFGLVNLSP